MITELEVAMLAADPATAGTRLYMTDTMALWVHARCAMGNLHMQRGHTSDGEPRGWSLTPSNPRVANKEYNADCFDCRQP